MNFSDRVLEAIDRKRSFVVVGLDPELHRIPRALRPAERMEDLNDAAAALLAINRCVIDVVASRVVAVKPQIAFYERFGVAGLQAFVETVAYARQAGLLVIEDAKRGDIGKTATAYSDGHLGRAALSPQHSEPVFDVDAITVNPYMGLDAIQPFIDAGVVYDKGVFVLVKTSNPSSVEIQDLTIANSGHRVFEHVARLVQSVGATCIGARGYSLLGAVVGATYPEHARALRAMMPQSLFLVPGYGAQGASGAAVASLFNGDGYGALISASRSIMFPQGVTDATRDVDYRTLVADAVTTMNEDINTHLAAQGALPW